MLSFVFIGGIILALISQAATVPATIWVIQSTFSHGLRTAIPHILAIACASLIWAAVAALLLFQNIRINYLLDPAIRLAGSGLMLYMAFSVKGSAMITHLGLDHTDHPSKQTSFLKHWKNTFFKALSMPWRLPLWIVLITATGAPMRAPGTTAALLLALGVGLGTVTWHIYFATLTRLFGHRVPESICLKSLNKLRLLAFIVFLGLSLLVLAPLSLRLQYG